MAELSKGPLAAGSAVHMAMQSILDGAGALSFAGWSSQWPIAIATWSVVVDWALAGAPAMPRGISTSATSANSLKMAAAMAGS